MEIFVDNILEIDPLRKNKNSVNNDFKETGKSESETSFKDQLLQHINQLVHERGLIELQAQFAPVISSDRMSYIMASNSIHRLRVRG